MTNIHLKRTTCRGCGSGNLMAFLSLGSTPLANAFLRDPSEFASERLFPLDVYFCRNCTLVQLLDVIDAETLFREYIYVTGTSSTMAAHNRAYVRSVADILQLRPDDLVVEIASNDGSLLHCFQELGVRTLGVEPASNIAAMARAKGLDTLNEFFDGSIAAQIAEDHGRARVVVANNVLAHVDDTLGFLTGCRDLLRPDGRLVIEVPSLSELIRKFEYDTIYHEHLCYFSLTAFLRLLDVSCLRAVRVDRVSVHGGSMRVHATRADDMSSHESHVLAMASAEAQAGLGDASCYTAFAAAVKEHRSKLSSLLDELQARGNSLAAYGAPAKGNTLLNFCRFTTDLIPYTVDKNPHKVGLYTPGAHLPVFDAKTLLERQPDLTLLLAWNFADEILVEQQTYRQRGGRFILPIPEPRIV